MKLIRTLTFFGGLAMLVMVVVVVYTFVTLLYGSYRQGKPLHKKERCMRNKMKKEYDFSKGKRGIVIPVPKGKT